MAKKRATNLNIVAADPAKDFFVSMLIKDITLRDAIGDLVDNAVDAIKAQATDSTNLKGYEVDIKLGKSYFSISDNGLGMEAIVARKTAFNFGKSPEHKLIDVAKWLKKPKTREFAFDQGTLKEGIKNRPNKTGLKVHISNLSLDSKTSFTDRTFIDTLKKEISQEHMLNINKGLIIKIEGYTLKSNQITLVNDDKIKPTYWEQASNGNSVKVLAGISSKDSEDGGWYIFCNDRLILAKNKTAETVWTGSKGDGVPLWHAQYFRFRGYVFFEAKDSSELPWNTTKTGMDSDSPYYKGVRNQMITMTKQVMGLLDKLKEEKEGDNPEENQTLNKSVDKSLKSAAPVTKTLKKTNALEFKFSYPDVLFNPIKRSKSKKISYQVTNEKFEAVKQQLGVNSSKEIGLKTFNYYYDNEI